MMVSATNDPDRPATGKLVQICASQNDLFALDSDGVVYQYDFNCRTWERLDARRTYNALPRDRA